MSVRYREYTSLVKGLLGPRGGSGETLEDGKDPRNEYVTGILEPKDYTRLIEDYGNADIGTFVAETEGVEDNIDSSNDFEINPTYFDPRALPKSVGLSFVVKSNDKPLIDICVTWARYIKEGKKWRRQPNRFIQRDVDASVDTPWRPAKGIRIVLRQIKLEDNIWHVSIYLVNEMKVERFLNTSDLIFQPQIRVNFHSGVTAVSVDRRRLQGQEEGQLELLYSRLQGLARGHLCGATWKEIDPERPFEGITENPFIPDDVKNLPSEEKLIFINPHVRTEYLPSYTVKQSTVEVEDISTMKRNDTDAGVLAEQWDHKKLGESLEKIVKQYCLWIENQNQVIDTLHDSQKHIALENLNRCKDSCMRIQDGINLLGDPTVRLAFCFMNKVMDTQSFWARKTHLVWRPFQMAFILQCIPGIVDRNHPDRNICDLLWYPTGGGKTEAYLGLMIFTLALRRLRGNRDGLSPIGTAIISRYTLRLLTIQQFRRALAAITVAEYLRIKKWVPDNVKEKPQLLWGDTRFSIGLWLGGDVTPNNVVDHSGWDNTRKISTRYPGAISILKYSHRKTSIAGERVSYSGNEPAQVLKCPCCSKILSIPAAGLSGNEHEVFWIVKKDQKPTVIASSLDYRDFRVRDVKVYNLPNPEYFSIQVTFTVGRGSIDDDSIWEWWKQKIEQTINCKLACAAPSRPGYFVVTAPDVYRSPVDFEIHCPNPECELNKDEWFEVVPGDKKTVYFTSPEPFMIPNKNTSFSIPIPAYTADAQVYTRCPSIIIATVDKFARLPFEPRSAAIFGNVNKYDSIWGYHRDIAPPDKGNSKKNGVIVDVSGFLPPELIIQDELHLIEGPLGSMVGLYETSIDLLAMRVFDGKPVIPKYIASTATTRQASTQIRALYNRELRQFPQSGITALDTFFSSAIEGHPLDDQGPGRLYVGVCAPGKGPQTPTIRIWSSVMQEAERIRRQGTGNVEGELDYFWTVVGYFNAIRELAAARSLYRQDIPEWIKQMDGDTNARRTDEFNLVELNSNTNSSKIPAILEQLERTGGGVDAVMATSMFGTGVDIDRLSLMIVHGQPKTTASYIQATGRVGRKKGALVITFLRSTRPRDLDHYEFFTGYHRALHRYVEPVTVAPFSPRACDRGLGPIAVAILRNGVSVSGIRVNPNWAGESEYWKGSKGKSGSRIMSTSRRSPELQAIIDSIENRSQQQPENRRRIKDMVKKNLGSDFDDWKNIATIEDSLFYSEPAFNYQPNSPVVLGDAQHRQNKKRMVFENTPQSMRDVESTTRFGG